MALLATTWSGRADALTEGFLHPPDSTKPWVYWYWISDNISREGITKDLEAMERVGIGEAFIGNIFLEGIRPGSVKALSEEWWGMVEHAIREGGRLGVDIGMFNCPGWSQSGGPWIGPEQAMRYLASTERRVRGPRRFEEVLPAPASPFQDVRVLAFPAPAGEADCVATRAPLVSCTPAGEGANRLVDGDRETVWMFPPGAGQGSEPLIVDIALAEPFAARSLVLYPSKNAFAAQCEFQVEEENGAFRKVRSFSVDRSNTAIGVGFMPHGPVAVSFPAQNSRRFRLVLTQVRQQGGLAEIELSGGARLERFIEKQLAKMHPTPLPRWDTYLWPPTAEPESSRFLVLPDTVLDLSDALGGDGTLRWDVPEGDWIVLRMGMTPTGTKNAPASPEGQGLEVDKMNRRAAQAHFEAFIGQLLSRLPAQERRAFKHVVADSYEMGSQNWTDGFGELFRERYGYDAASWLPVLTGRVVGSADQSDRFLWDLRRLVADRVAYDYVGGLRDACHEQGLKLWLENYGHWGFPAEFLQYGGQADRVGGEFWATGDLGSIELRAASSAAHIYGKPIVSAEAFTSVLKFQSTPWSLKRRGDWALTEGINHWILHVYIHQPWEHRRPGVNAWFSTEFNRHNTWFDPSRAWIDYYRRCHFLLQQGRHVADVAYFIGEDTPKMTGIRDPKLPPGYDYDYLNAEVIEQRLRVEDERFVLPDGKSYRLLVLPELETMRPELLRAVRDLVAAGGAILGSPPSRSPSLQNYPVCDAQVRQMADALWAQCRAGTEGMTQGPFGAGRVYRHAELQPVLDQLETPPDVSGMDSKDVLWTHRADGQRHLYFLSNQSDQTVSIVPRFRVPGLAPELWDAVRARIVKPAVFEAMDDGVRLPIVLGPRDSVFVVFREAIGKASSLTEVRRNGQVLMTTGNEASSLGAAHSRPEETGLSLPVLELGRGTNGFIEVQATAGGAYALASTSGANATLEVETLPDPLPIEGPWEVRFPSWSDVPERVLFERLMSWTEHPNQAIQHFSGTATYRRTFELPADRLGDDQLHWLDLGRVGAMAEVFLNEQPLGVLWNPPYLVNVTRFLEPGSNTLEVRVTGTWANRLIGEAKRAASSSERIPGAPTADRSRFKPYLALDIQVRPDEALTPSGLIGPVRLHSGKRFVLRIGPS